MVDRSDSTNENDLVGNDTGAPTDDAQGRNPFDTPLATSPSEVGPVRPKRWRFLGYAALLVLGVGVFVAIAFAAMRLVSGDDAEEGSETTTTASVPTTQPSDPEVTQPPTQDPNQPGQWIVTGVDASEGLNVRAAPGTDSEVIGQFAPFFRDVMATGETQNVGDVLWQEVEFDTRTGWVSSEFLSPYVACNAAAVPASATDVSQSRFDIDGDGEDDSLRVYTSGDNWHLRVDFATGEVAHALMGPAGEAPQFTTTAGFDVTGDLVDDAVLATSDGDVQVYRFVQLRNCDLVILQTNEGAEFTLREVAAEDVSYAVTCTGQGGEFVIQQITNERLTEAAGSQWQTTITHWALVGNAMEIQKVDVSDPLPAAPQLPPSCEALT